MITSIPFPPTEGIGYYTWNLSRFLMNHGHQVQIITRGQRGKQSYEESENIPIWRPQFFPLYPFHVHSHKLFVQKLVNQIEEDVDLFHLHTPLPPPIQTKRPVLLTIHSMMLADAQARKIDSFFDFLTKLQSPVSFLIEKQLIHISQSITAVSPAAAEQLQHCLPKGHCQAEITWNGVDSSFFVPDSQASHNPYELLFVGRLAPGKGLQDLIQAFKIALTRTPKINLSIVGNGPLHARILSLIEHYKLKDHVKLLGHVTSRETLRTLYQQACGLIVPSHHESLPNVILEAMACGTPVIATQVGSIPAVINNGVNGLLVSPRNPDAIAEAIGRLVNDSSLHDKLGQAARKTIEKKFTWQIIGGNYLFLYDEILSRAVP